MDDMVRGAASLAQEADKSGKGSQSMAVKEDGWSKALLRQVEHDEALLGQVELTGGALL